MKVAIIQDWLEGLGGAEKCVEVFCELWPQADIYALAYEPSAFTDSIISNHQVSSSFIQRLPFSPKRFRNYLPLFPLAIEQFDLRAYDLVISSSAAFSHGVLTHHEQLHICYKHTPMRYAWSGYQEYLQDPKAKGKLKNLMLRRVIHRLRMWDYQAAQRPDILVANSRETQKRIQRYYQRDSQIIHPPVDPVDEKIDSKDAAEPFYLVLSRLVPYKKADRVAEAFLKMPQRKLIVAGDGPQLRLLQKMAEQAPNITVLGAVSEARKNELLKNAQALVFASYEDFGIVPLEAQSYSTPVIAFGKGGSCETVIDGKTGVLFSDQSVESIVNAVERFEQMQGGFKESDFQANVNRFTKAAFQQRIQELVDREMTRLKDEG
ncbi:MAG: glycosyltransferase [Planctomycetota bacterium]|jgi:glycosyltransferase involved in cell wall biosynthesis